jgi:hypothetical protein
MELKTTKSHIEKTSSELDAIQLSNEAEAFAEQLHSSALDGQVLPTNPKNADRSKDFGYIESFYFQLGLVAVGFSLQWVTGSFPSLFTHWPVNGFVFIGCLVGFPLLYLFSQKSRLTKWIGSIPNAIISIAFFALLTIIMGILPQHASDGHAHTGFEAVIEGLGFYEMTSSWAFAFILGWFGISLAFSTLKRCFPLEKKNSGYLLGHAGLWITLLAATLGSGDLQRLQISVDEGNTEWRATDNDGHVYELDMAVNLIDFRMTVFPPKLVLAEMRDGDLYSVEGQGNVVELTSEPVGSTHSLNNYTIKVNRYIENAFYVQDGYVESPQDGAAEAVEITVSGGSLEAPITDWVSAGSFLQPPSFLTINEQFSIAMPTPEPKSFVSEVQLLGKDETPALTTIEVNKPFSYAGLKIYQLSYDDRYGKWSPNSVLEVISDPWLPVVYFGIFLMIGSAVYMIYLSKQA